MSVRRIAIVAAATAVAIPLSFAAAGSASAAESPLDAVSSITDTGNLPLAGDLLGGAADPTSALKGTPAEGLAGGLPLGGDPLAAVTGLLGEGGLEKTVAGLPVAGPLVGGRLGGGQVPTGHKPSGSSHKPVRFENTSLPHTGGDADMTALLMCAGLAVAGTGVTLVTRRRRGAAI